MIRTVSTHITSPLRYPGGKKKLAETIAGFIEANDLEGCSFYEPYAGGASVSIHLLWHEIVSKATLVERDPLLFAFWTEVFHDSERFCQAIRDLDVSLEQLREFRKLTNNPKPHRDPLRMALACLMLNRCNYSGILHAGPIGGKNQASDYSFDCRFNKDRLVTLIADLGRFGDRVEVIHDDAVAFLRRRAGPLTRSRNALVYLDPPYVQQSNRG